MSSRLPSLKPREVLRALERAGFYVHYTGPGSHVQLKHRTDPTKRVKDFRNEAWKAEIVVCGIGVVLTHKA